MTEKTVSAAPEPEKLARRKFLGLASVALFAPVLAGCTRRSETYRYRLTLSLNTPEGVKTGSVVNEVTHSEVWGPTVGWAYPSRHRGQALFVDMGNGRKPLIALMAFHCNYQERCPGLSSNEELQLSTWTFTGPTSVLANNPQTREEDDWTFFKAITKWNRLKPHLDLKPQEVPDLITFRDINDPLTVELVDPRHLEDKLGAGVSWNTMTLDVLDDSTPVEFNLETKLPWYDRMRKLPVGLDGDTIVWGQASGKWSLPNSIRVYDFEHGRN